MLKDIKQLFLNLVRRGSSTCQLPNQNFLYFTLTFATIDQVDTHNSMDQREFTDIVVSGIRGIFPQTRQYQIEGHKDVAYLEIASKRDKLGILISTRDSMLTIGFSAGPGLFYWHEHLLGEELIEDKVLTAAEIISEILQDKKGIIYSSVLGFFPGDPEDLQDEYKEENETIELKYWSDF